MIHELRSPLSPGDPVDVRVTTQDGTRLWVPAVVTAYSDGEIALAYSDGRKQSYRRGTIHFRRKQHG